MMADGSLPAIHARRCLAVLVAATISIGAVAQTVSVTNPSFEEGQDAPFGWTLSEGRGDWLSGDAADGARALAVTGDGNDSNFWRSAPVAFAPSSVYTINFNARSLGSSGGTPMTGPIFCNRDIGGVPAAWTPFSSVFVTPRHIAPENAWLRFGQWHVRGTVAFDAISVVATQAIHRRLDGVTLGEGESISGNRYAFNAPFASLCSNHSRPLAFHQASFNTNRWVLSRGSEVVYRHEIDGRRQVEAEVEVVVNYYVAGTLVVEAGQDGENWRQLGAISGQEPGAFVIPGPLLPADTIWVRLRVDDNPDAALQVTGYSYRARLDGEPIEMSGSTRYVSLLETDDLVNVELMSLGDTVPGGDNAVAARLTNRSDRAVSIRPTVAISRDDAPVLEFSAPATELPPGERVLNLPYELPGSGTFAFEFSLGPDRGFHSRAEMHVAELFDTSYGERLPGASDAVGLWWASSGWKVSATRPEPSVEGAAVLIRAARAEAEAAQLVVRPARDLRGLTATCGPLSGPNGAVIPADSIDILRVRYLPVTYPTDNTGVAALWPDPLPPFDGPIDVPGGVNQPLWIRVTTPRDIAAGLYTGSVTLSAEGYRVEAPLHVEVYDFELPTRMTCTTAFGFSPGLVYRYHKLTEPEHRRAVIEKYLENFSAHRISPYNPAPLDPIGITWPSLGKWRGGRRVSDERRSGAGSLLLDDPHTEVNVAADYVDSLPIGEKGFRLSLWYRTREPGMKGLVTVSHQDARGEWMSGRNRDIVLTGDGTWQRLEQVVTEFPQGARTVRLTLRATLWADDGSTTGATWYDDVSLVDIATERELIEEGDFEPLPLERLVPEFDWTAWDSSIERAIDLYGFNSFQLPVHGLGGGTFHSRTEPSLLGFMEDTPEYRQLFSAYVRGLESHLRDRGWLDEAYVYWFDEPDPKDYEFVMNGFRKLKRYAPAINRMLTEQIEPELVGGPNIWCPLTPDYDPELAAERRREGDRFWWYICTGPKAPYATLFIDHPGAELRVWLWQTWQFEVEGILIWETNYWTSDAAYPDQPQNPYEDPMGWVSGYSTPAGVRSPWGNGDGRFIYPPEAAADANPPGPLLEGPVDSIRWEMLRDGVEDYEYFVILRDLIEARRDRIPVEELGYFEGLLEVPATVSEGLTVFTKDPAPIEEHRDRIARAIERLRNM